MNKQLIYPIFAGILGVFCTIGLTRMSFGMVLPFMQNGLGISTTEIGLISTANFTGYFLGIFLANYFYTHFSTTKVIITFIILEALCIVVMVSSAYYFLIALCYFLIGVCSAIAYISVMSYVADVVAQKFKGMALGTTISGNSLAIITSGAVVFALSTVDISAWELMWLVFAFLLFILTFAIKYFIGTHHKVALEINKKESNIAVLRTTSFWKMASIYIVFGLSYTIFITYFVSNSIVKWQIDASNSSYFWIVLGAISLISGPLFGKIADIFGAYFSFIWVYLLQATASLLLVFDISNYMILYVSAFCFGISVWAPPSLIVLLSANHFGATHTTKPLSIVTLFFSLAQIIGPASGGYLFDITGSYDAIFFISFVISALASVLCLFYSQQKFITH